MDRRIFGKADESGGSVEMTRRKTPHCGPASRYVEQTNAGHDPPIRLCYCTNETTLQAADTEPGMGARSLVGEESGGRSDEP